MSRAREIGVAVGQILFWALFLYALIAFGHILDGEYQ